MRGDRLCIAHSQRHRARFMAGAVKGGATRGLALRHPATGCIADGLDVDGLDLASPAGIAVLLGAVLRGLAKLPLDTRVGNAIAQTATAQRNVIEAADLAARVAVLEAALPSWPRH